MFTPTSAATSRVRSPSNPCSAIWLKAARTSARWRSSLYERETCVELTRLIRPSIKHLMEPFGVKLPLRRWPMFNQSRVAAMLPAQDLDRAKAFYRDKFGLTPTPEMGDDLGFYM